MYLIICMSLGTLGKGGRKRRRREWRCGPTVGVLWEGVLEVGCRGGVVRVGEFVGTSTKDTPVSHSTS